MKFSEAWLRLWVNPDVTTSELAEKLTMAGLEVGEVTPVAEPFSQVVVGEILAVQLFEPKLDIPGQLVVCQVRVKEGVELTIVSNALANIVEGYKVPVALKNAVLASGKIVKEVLLAGITSQGLLCTAAELGLADSDDAIIRLADNAPLGMPCWDYFCLDDMLLELDLTPNRGDCLSINGIAREVAALFRLPVTETTQEPVIPTIDDVWQVNIENQDDCPRYTGRIIKNIRNHAMTPVWMQERLRRSGIRSINPVVDVTNYVMLELGQPMHGFDLATLQGSFVVRRAKAGEKLTLLDGHVLTLQPNSLIIADDSGVIDLAGIMGSMSTRVTEKSQDIFLESAFFSPRVIAGRARQYGLSTDASHRFERGVDYTLQERALERATELLVSIVGGEVGPVTSMLNAEALPQPVTLLLRKKRIARILGIEIADQDVVALLTPLGLNMTAQTEGWSVQVPSHRFDLALEIDLIEEVGRLYGYEQVKHLNSTQITGSCSVTSETQVDESRFITLLQDLGYQEVITYSFVDPKLQKLLEPDNTPLALTNPISADMAVMRTSLWAGLIHTMLYNINRQHTRMKLFEVGMTFVQQQNELKQSQMISGALYGANYPEQWNLDQSTVDFYDLKGEVERLCSLTGALETFTFKPAVVSCLHPGQCAAVYRAGELIGHLGALHPQISQALALKSPVFLFEFDLDKLSCAKIPQYQLQSKFPFIRRDLALLVQEDLSYQALYDAIYAINNELLQQVLVFDVYRGEGIAAGKKSLAIALIMQHINRTLVDDEINDLVLQVVTTLKDKFDVMVRN